MSRAPNGSGSMKRWLPLIPALILVQVGPAGAGGLEGSITLPPGFSISVFASGLASPRFMAWSARGDLLVSLPRRGGGGGLRGTGRGGRGGRRRGGGGGRGGAAGP